jgi:hypothetical protein
MVIFRQHKHHIFGTTFGRGVVALFVPRRTSVGLYESAFTPT